MKLWWGVKRLNCHSIFIYFFNCGGRRWIFVMCVHILKIANRVIWSNTQRCHMGMGGV
jgi:hypothetical protein